MIFLYLLLFVSFPSEFYSQTLKQIHILFRHGERTPTDTYASDPYINYSWPNGLGSLTNRGKLQMYNLGILLREQYDEFMTDSYNGNEVKIVSSYADRCLMSAELVLSGMYPPKGLQIWNQNLLWQPIPISYKPRNQDNMIAAKQKCAKYDEAFEELYKSNEMQEINRKNTDLYEYLTEHAGMEVSNIITVENIFNTLEIEQLHNFSLPQWTEEVYPEKMKPLAALSLASFSYTDYMKRLKGGVYLEKVIRDMENKIVDDSSPKVHIYSGHDITIVHVLRALRMVDTIKPDFGAYVVIELYLGNPQQVKVLYSNTGWNRATELEIPGCSAPCSLVKFIQNYKSVLPVNWDEDCSN